jgi:hypothetical protein
MPETARRRSRWWIVLGSLLGIALALAWYFRDDILSNVLDPKVPFQIYRPPPAPDYAQREAWALYPDRQGPQTPGADVFFIHPTSYDGGSQWVGPIPQPRTDPTLYRVMLPNYAGPFGRLGRVFAPRYRHASLYALLRPYRDDAREAQEFAYQDVRRAFLRYLAQDNRGRPFILAGAEQGALHATRLLRDEIAGNPALRSRLVAVYLMEAVVPADEYAPDSPVPACHTRDEAPCVLAWASVVGVDLQRTARLRDNGLVWGRRRLTPIGERPPLCVNPLLGTQSDDLAPARLNVGAANATGLEWGARPAFLVHQVSARCSQGLLLVSRPRSASLQRNGTWTAALEAPAYNLFYADVEADAMRRLAAWRQAHPEYSGWVLYPPLSDSAGVPASRVREAFRRLLRAPRGGLPDSRPASTPPPSSAPQPASRTAPAAPAAPAPAG